MLKVDLNHALRIGALFGGGRSKGYLPKWHVRAPIFETLGLPTKLSAYGIKEDVAAKVTARLEQRGFQPMGEKGLVTLEKVREVLRVASQ